MGSSWYLSLNLTDLVGLLPDSWSKILYQPMGTVNPEVTLVLDGGILNLASTYPGMD